MLEALRIAAGALCVAVALHAPGAWAQTQVPSETEGSQPADPPTGTIYPSNPDWEFYYGNGDLYFLTPEEANTITQGEIRPAEDAVSIAGIGTLPVHPTNPEISAREAVTAGGPRLGAVPPLVFVRPAAPIPRWSFDPRPFFNNQGTQPPGPGFTRGGPNQNWHNPQTGESVRYHPRDAHHEPHLDAHQRGSGNRGFEWSPKDDAWVAKTPRVFFMPSEYQCPPETSMCI